MSELSTEKEEEKKGGAVPPWMTGTAKVGSGLGSGGSSAAGSGLAKIMGLLAAPKAIVALTVAGGLAMGMGVVSTIKTPEEPSLAMRFNREKVKTAAPTSSLPGMSGASASALNLAQEANSGFYADPNAAAAQEAAAEADAAADAPADPEAPEGAAQGEGGPADPASQMAALMGAEGKTKSGLANKFGKLSAGGGASSGMRLAGGAGLSGGIGGNFKQSKLSNSRAGQLSALSGANRAQVSRSKLAANNLGKSSLRGATAKRLDKMNRAMGKTGAASAADAASVHSQQWDGAQPGGSAITGSGASGISGGGDFSGDEGLSGGGPLDNPSASGGGGTSGAPGLGSQENKTPYQGQLDMARMMLLLASGIVTVIGILSMFSKVPIIGQFLEAFKTILLVAALGLAAGAAAIGASIGSQFGQADQSQIITIGGGITAATAAAAMIWPTLPSWVLVLGGIAGLAAGISGGGGDGGKLRDREDISVNDTGNPRSFEEIQRNCEANGGTLQPTDNAFQPYQCMK